MPLSIKSETTKFCDYKTMETTTTKSTPSCTFPLLFMVIHISPATLIEPRGREFLPGCAAAWRVQPIHQQTRSSSWTAIPTHYIHALVAYMSQLYCNINILILKVQCREIFRRHGHNVLQYTYSLHALLTLVTVHLSYSLIGVKLTF